MLEKRSQLARTPASAVTAKFWTTISIPIEAEARNKLLRDENGGDSDLVPSREIKIGKNCFIGCNSIILKGTVLGDGCVVGAGAVVAGKFEDNCVIAGNPARVIKRIDRQ